MANSKKSPKSIPSHKVPVKKVKKRGGAAPGRRGKGFERELVNLAKANIPPVAMERTWGSDGRSRGLDKRVDIIVGSQHFICELDAYGQSKRTAKLPIYFREIYSKEVDSGDCVIFYAEERDPLVAIKWVHFMDLCCGTYVEFKVVTENRKIGKLFSPEGETISFQIFREDNKKYEIILTIELKEVHRLFPKLQNLPII